MRTIYKYPLGERTTLALPEGARVRLVAMQRGHVTLWVEQVVGEGRALEERTFTPIATGNPIPENARHCGSAIYPDAGEIWHVYELIP